jgi:hypothetical protein
MKAAKAAEKKRMAEERKDRLEMKAAEKKRRAEERLALKAAEQNAAERLEQNTAAEAVEGVVPWQPWQPWF